MNDNYIRRGDIIKVLFSDEGGKEMADIVQDMVWRKRTYGDLAVEHPKLYQLLLKPDSITEDKDEMEQN